MKKKYIFLILLCLCNATQQPISNQYCSASIFNRTDNSSEEVSNITIGSLNSSTNKSIRYVYKKPHTNDLTRNQLVEYEFNLNDIKEIQLNTENPILKLNNEEFVNIILIKKDYPNEPDECIIARTQKLIGKKSKGITKAYPFDAINKVIMHRCSLEEKED